MLRTYWWKTPRGLITNFGDQLNPYLIERITGVKPVHTEPSPEYVTMLGIGSVLGLFMDKLKYCVVWGSGFGRKPSKLKYFLKRREMTVPQKIVAVRGPLTRKAFEKFNISCPSIYGDPALLMPRFYNPVIGKKYKIGLIPHYTDYNNEWILRNQKENILIINVNKPAEEVIREMLSCSVLLSSSLHGLIIADAYRIPSCWIMMSEFMKRQCFKFMDYFHSLGCTDEKPIIIKNPDMAIETCIKYARVRKITLDLDNLLNVCPLLN